MTQKELKEMYMNIIKTEVWEDEYMQNFAKKNCAYVVQFSNGDIADIEKPSIKKGLLFWCWFLWYLHQRRNERRRRHGSISPEK